MSTIGNWWKRLFAAERVTTTSDVGWTTLFGGSNNYLPGSNQNWERLAGDPANNAVASTIIGWVARTLPESPPIVTRPTRDGSRERYNEHPILALLNYPNGQYSGDQLMAATIRDYMANGNAYWRIQRNGAGRAAGLWYVPASTVKVVAGDTTDNFIDHYELRINASHTESLPTDDLVHFRYALDPLTGGRTGIGPFRALYRSIVILNMGENFEASILRKHGAPGLFLSVSPEGGPITLDEARLWKQSIDESTSGDNAGKTIVGLPGSVLTAFGFSPEQLALTTMLDRYEALMCAATGINPVVLGLKVGLEHSTYANMEEAQRSAYEKAVIPMKSALAMDITNQLLYTEFDKRSSGYEVEYDYSGIECLSDKQDDLVARLVSAAGGPYLTPNEARVQAGLDPIPDGDTLRTKQPTPVPQAFGNGNGVSLNSVQKAFVRGITDERAR